MTTNLALSGLEDRTSVVGSALVAEYKRAHQEMLAVLQVMDAMAFDPPASLLKLSHTRLRITRAANDCRAALRKVLDVLSKLPSPTIARKIEVLEELHAKLREAARDHMAAWPHAAAQAEWRTYYESHTRVAQLWREVIERERQLLYPML